MALLAPTVFRTAIFWRAARKSWKRNYAAH